MKLAVAVLTVIANYVAKDDAILQAEITASNGADPDSTPGNGVDTNGNGKIVKDKGMRTTGMQLKMGLLKNNIAANYRKVLLISL